MNSISILNHFIESNFSKLQYTPTFFKENNINSNMKIIVFYCIKYSKLQYKPTLFEENEMNSKIHFLVFYRIKYSKLQYKPTFI
jgi:hypothetical protein